MGDRGAFQVALVVKNLPANTGDTGSIPRGGRSPGEGHGNPLYYSCLENSVDRVAWRATVHGVARESDMTECLSTAQHWEACPDCWSLLNSAPWHHFLQLYVNPADTWHNLPDIRSSISHVQLQLII